MLPVILVHLWCIQNKLVLKKDTGFIHVAMGGVKKVFTHVEGGSKSFGGLRRGGQKSLTTKIFNWPAPPPKYLWTLPYVLLCNHKYIHCLNHRQANDYITRRNETEKKFYSERRQCMCGVFLFTPFRQRFITPLEGIHRLRILGDFTVKNSKLEREIYI